MQVEVSRGLGHNTRGGWWALCSCASPSSRPPLLAHFPHSELEDFVEDLKKDSSSASRVVTLKDVEDGAFLLRQVGEAVATLKGECFAGEEKSSVCTWGVWKSVSRVLGKVALAGNPGYFREAEAEGSLEPSLVILATFGRLRQKDRLSPGVLDQAGAT
jgi:hypothetical protein